MSKVFLAAFAYGVFWGVLVEVGKRLENHHDAELKSLGVKDE